jgi:hypothetical protein
VIYGRFRPAPPILRLVLQRVTQAGGATVGDLGLGDTTSQKLASTPLKIAHCPLTRPLGNLYDPGRQMKQRFAPFRRAKVFYFQDSTTGDQQGLRTNNEPEACALLHSKNEAFKQPVLNLQMARAYLSASDPQIGLWSCLPKSRTSSRHSQHPT